MNFRFAVIEKADRSDSLVLCGEICVFVAEAKIDGASVGTLTVTVVEVDLKGPVAGEVNFQREKDVLVNPASEAPNITFTPNDAALMSVSVKQLTADGATLFLKPLSRGTPVVVARLGGAAGPIISTQEVDEFTLDVPARIETVIDDLTDVGTTNVTIRPFIPDLTFKFTMSGSQSTFEEGAASFTANTNDFIQVFVPEISETVGQLFFDLEVPDEVDAYCFNLDIEQAGSDPVPVGKEAAINGKGCKATVAVLSLCVGEVDTLVLKLVKKATDKHPVKIRKNPVGADKKGTAIDTATEPVFTVPDTTPDSDTWGKQFDCGKEPGDQPANKVKGNLPAAKQFDTFHVLIGCTLFLDRIHVSRKIKMKLRFTGRTTPNFPVGLNDKHDHNQGVAGQVTTLGSGDGQNNSLQNGGREGVQNLMEVQGILCPDETAETGWDIRRDAVFKIWEFTPTNLNAPNVILDQDIEAGGTFGPPSANDDPDNDEEDLHPDGKAGETKIIVGFDNPRIFVDTPAARNAPVGTVRAHRLNAKEWIEKDGVVVVPPQEWHSTITIRKTAGQPGQIGTWKRVGPASGNEIGPGTGSVTFTRAEALKAQQAPAP